MISQAPQGILEIPPEKKECWYRVSKKSRASGAARGLAHAGSAKPESEESIRRLIAQGKSKAALDGAKQFHKQISTAASEGLLLDAYCARIKSLVEQQMAPEAKSLIDVVRERFPMAQSRLDAVLSGVAARDGDLDGLLRPLNDPQLDAERRAAIEQAIRTQLTDLNALAKCAALPAEHGLRQAAAALDQAFQLVTTGPVTDEQIALAEVSHRSPLAGWKTLIRAIAAFYRKEGGMCRELLGAIKADSVPARLGAAVEAMLGSAPAVPLKQGAAKLVAAVSGGAAELKEALEKLEEALQDGSDAAIHKAIRNAVQECRRVAPEQLARLKRSTSVRSKLMDLDPVHVASSMEGAAVEDAEYFRVYSRAHELEGEFDFTLDACATWDLYRRYAVREGLFKEQSMEAAALYLHMASLFDGVPKYERAVEKRRVQESVPKSELESIYYWYPEKLYARACALDPSRESFAKWLSFAKDRSLRESERVAQAWSRACPGDLEPVLFLMKGAEERSNYPTALGLLAQAERIDAVHSQVRAARLRLLAASAIRHVQQKKPHLAEAKLAEMAALPQASQGDRPAFLAAMREIISFISKQHKDAGAAHIELEGLLEGRTAAHLLVSVLGGLCKRKELEKMPPLQEISKPERASIPAAFARVTRLMAGIGFTKYDLPANYANEVENQFSQVSGSLSLEDLRDLAHLGRLLVKHKLTWSVSNAGLARGGTSEAFFLMARAHAMPGGVSRERVTALAAAAVALGRAYGDSEVVEIALKGLRNPFSGEVFSLTIEQAREVVKREQAWPKFPSPGSGGPKYHDLVSELRLPTDFFDLDGDDDDDDEFGDEFDEDEFCDDDDDDDDDDGMPDLDTIIRQIKATAPPGVPPEIAESMAKVMLQGMLEGKSPEEIMAEMFGPSGARPKKGRKKR